MIANNDSTAAFNPKIAFQIYPLKVAILYYYESFGILLMTQDINYLSILTYTFYTNFVIVILMQWGWSQMTSFIFQYRM